MSIIGLGTAALGRPQYINIRQEDAGFISLGAFKKKGRETLDEAYRLGVRYFDTAPNYGLAESLLIDWLQSKGDLPLEVATKWGYTYVANFDPNATQHEIKEHSLSKLNEQWEQSRKLLPFLKTYQIHSATLETEVLENEAVLQRLAELKSEHDLIIGITTTGSNQVDVIRRALEVTVDGVEIFDAFQSTFNLLDQSLAKISRELHARKKRIIIKEAMANGRIFPNEAYPHYQAMYETLSEMANAYQVGVDAIALRFCHDALTPFTVLSGAATKQHLKENLAANNFRLSEADLGKLQGFSTAPDLYWMERKQLRWN